MTRVAELVDAVNPNRGWVGPVEVHHRELPFGAEGFHAGSNPAPGHLIQDHSVKSCPLFNLDI